MISQVSFVPSGDFVNHFKNRITKYCKGLAFIILVLTSANLFAQENKISGVVTGKEDGFPLSGVSISIKGTNISTQTDNQGKFSIVTPSNNSTLVFTSVGFTTLEMQWRPGNNLNVTLTSDTRQMNEVVVSGYAIQNKKDFTGSASRVGGAQFENKPVQSFEQALAGQAAGVSVIQSTGVLNNPPVFRIRGTNSISLSSYPLIIIDGIAAFTGSVGNSAPNNPLADINAEDIESLDILKDASATAIYGSRAANGVVVITTKKGKIGRTKVTYDGSVGVAKVMNLPELLNADQFVTIKNEARVNAGLAPAFFIQTRTDGSKVETNWYDYTYQTGVSHNHNISFSGANDATSYYLSVGYSDQEGILINNTFNRKIARVNLNHKLYKNITIGTNFSYSNSFNNSPHSGALPGQSIDFASAARLSFILPPNVSPFKEDGSYNVSGNSLGGGANTVLVNNYNLVPLTDLNLYTSESNNLLGALYGEWRFLKDFSFKTNYSLSNLNVENITFNTGVHGLGFGSGGFATNVASKYTRTNWTNTLNYSTSIYNNHNVNVLAGYEEIDTKTNSWGASRSSLTDPYFTTYQGGYSVIVPAGNFQGLNGFRSFFGSLNYDYKKKYLLSGSFRRDGFSGLSEENKYGNFYGTSIGWNISEENFYQNSSVGKIINSFKVRASYGQVGNINLGDFPASFFYGAGLYGSVATLGFTQAGNPFLKWETSKKTDVGINLGLFNGRISVDVDYYNNVIDGMVLNARQTPSLGIPGGIIATNVGSMYNRGFELQVTAQVINKRNFRWSSNFNLSTLKNRVTVLANGNADIFSSAGVGTQNATRVGYPVGSIWAVKTTGVNPQTGQRIYINRKGEEVQYNFAGNPQFTYLDGSRAPAIDGILDGRVSGSSIPTYYGGFNNTFTYYSFDVNLGIIFSGGNYIYNGTRAAAMDQRGFNNLTDVLRRWQKAGDVTDIPKVVYSDTYSSGYTVTNSSNVEDASFIRLKNASIGYKIPAKIISKAGIAGLRVYAQASNLLTLTKYRGSDPEISSNGNSNIGSGLDNISIGGARNFTFGVNVSF